jgi:tetratricopeptide (TPR) repeat protein
MNDSRPSATVLEGLLRSDPDSVALRSQLAEAYFRAGQFRACRDCIVQLQAAGIDTPLGRVALAILDFIEGHADGALAHVQHAESMSGVSAGLLELIGRLYLRLRRPLEGVRALDAAVALDPQRASIHDARAIAALFRRDLPEAEAAARRAIALNPASFEAHYHLGLILQRQRRADDAIEIFKQALSTDRPNVAAIHRRLADLYQHVGRQSLAFHHRALAGHSKQPRQLPRFDLDWLNQGLA